MIVLQRQWPTLNEFLHTVACWLAYTQPIRPSMYSLVKIHISQLILSATSAKQAKEVPDGSVVRASISDIYEMCCSWSRGCGSNHGWVELVVQSLESGLNKNRFLISGLKRQQQEMRCLQFRRCGFKPELGETQGVSSTWGRYEQK